MITNTGKQIIGKYLVGQTDAYAEYLAIGCGPKPLASGGTFGDYSTQKSLDFETLRIPVISKTLSTENGITKVILTAELPTEERYEITEIGVYPSSTNPIPTGQDNQNLYLFNSGESWQYHSGSTVSDIPLQLGIISNSNNDVTIADEAFFTNADNSLFTNTNYPNRLARYERPRFLNSTLFILGNTSTLTVSGSDLTAGVGSEHVHIAITPTDFSKNSTDDELRLAFSVVNKNGIGSSDIPSNVKVLVQFATTDDNSAEYASFVADLTNGAYENQINTQTPTGTTNITITTATSHNIAVGNKVTLSGITPSAYNGTWTAQASTTGSTLILDIGSNPGPITVGGRTRNENKYDFTNNRYVVVNRKLSQLYKTANFAWNAVAFVKVYVCVNNNSTGAGNFFIALDALRLENISSFSNVYGLTAYTVMKTSDSLPIVKLDNSSNFIEFKYVVDVL